MCLTYLRRMRTIHFVAPLPGEEDGMTKQALGQYVMEPATRNFYLGILGSDHSDAAIERTAQWMASRLRFGVRQSRGILRAALGQKPYDGARS